MCCSHACSLKQLSCLIFHIYFSLSNKCCFVFFLPFIFFLCVTKFYKVPIVLTYNPCDYLWVCIIAYTQIITSMNNFTNVCMLYSNSNKSLWHWQLVSRNTYIYIMCMSPILRFQVKERFHVHEHFKEMLWIP